VFRTRSSSDLFSIGSGLTLGLTTDCEFRLRKLGRLDMVPSPKTDPYGDYS
jgi:hypothetical protein